MYILLPFTLIERQYKMSVYNLIGRPFGPIS